MNDRDPQLPPGEQQPTSVEFDEIMQEQRLPVSEVVSRLENHAPPLREAEAEVAQTRVCNAAAATPKLKWLRHHLEERLRRYGRPEGSFEHYMDREDLVTKLAVTITLPPNRFTLRAIASLDSPQITFRVLDVSSNKSETLERVSDPSEIDEDRAEKLLVKCAEFFAERRTACCAR
jgi:hypothetical protein